MLKSTTAIVALLLISFPLLADTPGITDKWGIAKAETNDGGIVLFRYREKLPDKHFRSQNPHLLSIVWKYKSGSSSTLPNEQTEALMSTFENQTNALEDQALGYLVIIITGQNQREWVWYVADKQKFTQSLNKALGKQEKYPISLDFSEDPAWEMHAEFLKSMKQ